MELLKEVIQTVTEHDYIIQHPEEGILVYTEFITQDSGECIDIVLRSKHGHDIDDPRLLEEIQEFLGLV